MDQALADAVDAYRYVNRIPARAKAIRELLWKGIESDRNVRQGMIVDAKGKFKER